MSALRQTKAAGGLLHAVANFVMVLVFQALADDLVTDEIAQRIEAEHELALCRGNGSGQEQEQGETEQRYESLHGCASCTLLIWKSFLSVARKVYII